MSEQQVDLSVLPAEIRNMIYSHLVYISLRRNKKFKQELQLTWFNRCFERALSCDNIYQSLLQLLHDIDEIEDLETMRQYFHKRILEVMHNTHSRRDRWVHNTHSRRDRWVFTIYNFNEERREQFFENLFPSHYDIYIHGKIMDGHLTGYLLFFESLPFFHYLPFLYQLSCTAPMIDLVLSRWEEHLNSMHGRDVSFGNRQAFEQVIESEKKLLPLRFPTEYSNILLGKTDQDGL